MGNQILSRTKRWLGVSVLTLAVATTGVATLGLTTYESQAQVSVAPGAPGSFADLVDAVKPSVVSIAVEGVEQSARGNGNNGRRGRDQDFFNNFPDLPEGHPFRRFFDEFGDRFNEGDSQGQQQRPRKERKFQAAGSGFIISADGFVVTNNHVVERGTKVTVINSDGDEIEADVIGTDPRTDLALLKMRDVSDLPYVEFEDTLTRVGDWVVAVGNPFGLGGSVTAGIISARGRDIGGSATGDFLQIDAAVNSGNSGGPAFNLEGKVVGVNTAIFSPNGGNVGIAFAIPAAIVKQIVNDLKDDGEVTRGFLGVAIQDVSKDLAESVGLPTARGALVTTPSEGAPAAEAGIESGDVIVEVDGDSIDNALDLSRTIASKAPGTPVAVVVWRDGKRLELEVTLTVLTPEPEEVIEEEVVEEEADVIEPFETSVGLTLVPNAEGEGALIQAIDPDSAAATKGLRVGDIILEADNNMIEAPSDFEDAIKTVADSGRSTILVKTSRNGAVRFIGLPLNDE